MIAPTGADHRPFHVIICSAPFVCAEPDAEEVLLLWVCEVEVLEAVLEGRLKLVVSGPSLEPVLLFGPKLHPYG